MNPKDSSLLRSVIVLFSCQLMNFNPPKSGRNSLDKDTPEGPSLPELETSNCYFETSTTFARKTNQE